MQTYNQLYIDTRNMLRANGVEAANLEARLMVAGAAGKTTNELVRDFMLYTGDGVVKAVANMASRRLAGEPLAYILGKWEFYGLELNVDPDVLIPRVDTEVLVQEAIQAYLGRKNDPRVLDLCCGSGCIALAVAENTTAEVTAADVSETALGYARKNLADTAARVVQSDLFSALGGETFDVIVCNPPYIATAVIETLSPEVQAEPREALDGGADGLDVYRRLAAEYAEHLNPGGVLLLEIGYDQGESVPALFGGGRVYKDYAGNDRIVEVRKP